MPREGCKQCSKRRIKCDQASPACQKCVKKGLQCSGNGVEIRFVEPLSKFDGSLGRRVRRPDAGAVTCVRPQSERRRQERDALILSSTTRCSADETQSNLLVASPPSIAGDDEEIKTGSPHQRNAPCFESAAEKDVLPLHFDLLSSLLLQPLKPGISMLFDHFSTQIAPAMVAFDHPANGYRQMILPIAMHDDLVQHAVCVVSAFHLSSSQGKSDDAAEAGRSAIITRLRLNVASGGDVQVFNYSTLMTLLVLLVGETVTGSSEFAYLFNMLAAIIKDGRAVSDAPPGTREFLVQQSRMFQLFTPAFIDSEAGLNILCGDLDLYLDWLVSSQASNPSLSSFVGMYKSAIELARDIYLLELACNSSRSAIQAKVSGLRTLTEQICDSTPGMHVLVWSYFIAAASSKFDSDRNYFKARLRQIHNKTRMNNIPAAIVSLEHIWRHFPVGGWTSQMNHLRPVLAM